MSYCLAWEILTKDRRSRMNYRKSVTVYFSTAWMLMLIIRHGGLVV